MNIRKFEKGDGDKVKTLILSILTSEYPFDKNAFSDSDLNNITEAYSGGRDVFLVGDVDSDIVGTIGVKEEGPDSALIRRFFVSSKFRGRGYGKRLMEEALRLCKSNNFKHVIFQGTNRMIQAIELCKKTGFKEEEHLDLGGFFIYKFKLDL